MSLVFLKLLEHVQECPKFLTVSVLMEPTFNAVIEPLNTTPPPTPEVQVKKEVEEPLKGNEVQLVVPSDNYDPKCLFQALGMSFITGAVVGGLLVFAFSRREIIE